MNVVDHAPVCNASQMTLRTGKPATSYPDCSDAEIDAYVAANVRAVRDVVARERPDVALSNHLIMGPLVLARALGDAIPYAAKIHGRVPSGLEWPNASRGLM